MSYAFCRGSRGTYDHDGHVTQMQIMVGTTLTEVLNYAYDADGDLMSVGDAGCTTSYLYNALGQMTQVSQSGQSNTGVSAKQADFTYDNDGQTQTIVRYAGALPIATSTYGYNALGETTSLAQVYSGGSSSYGWGYDAAGNVTQLTATPDGTTNYSYDHDNQLTDGGQYGYDANGNRDTNGNSTPSGSDNELTYDGTYYYSYDNEGNVTAKFKDTDSGDVVDSNASDITTYTWDYENRLTAVSQYATYSAYQSNSPSSTVSYTYDSSDRLIGCTTTSGGVSQTTYTVYQGDNPLEDYTTTGGSSVKCSHVYLYGPAVDQILASDNCSGTAAGVLWGLADNEGTIRDVVNATGAWVDHRMYDAFGNLTSETSPAGSGSLSSAFPFGYDGERQDPSTGFYFSLVRWYDPSTGRFVSQDPSGLTPDTTRTATAATTR